MCTYPLDLIRARIAAQVAENVLTHRIDCFCSHATVQHYDGVWHALRQMVRTEGGIKALFQGVRPTLLV